MQVSNREREIINQVMKIFSVNKWCYTPEGVALFIKERGENIDAEKVHVVQQENIKKVIGE